MSTRQSNRPQSRRGKKRGRNNARSPKFRNVERTPTNNITMYRDPVQPGGMNVKLNQQFLFTLIAAGSNSIVKRFYSNSAWQPEIGGSTGAMPAFSKYAGMYDFYRVTYYKYKLSVTNMQPSGIVVYVFNTNDDPGTAATVVYANNRNSQVKQISQAGGMDRCIIKGQYAVSYVTGTTATTVADSFRSLTNANPADHTYLSVGIQSSNGALLSLGATVHMDLQLFTQFYGNFPQ